MRSAFLPCLSLLVPTFSAWGADLDSIAGVYKNRFTYETLQGEKMIGENILEIVPTGSAEVYFRVHLDFAAGSRSCGTHGVARTEGDNLVFVDPHPRRSCTLTFKIFPEGIVLADSEHTCTGYCGASESFDGAKFSRESRRPLRYMERLLNSPQFRESVKSVPDK